MRYSRQTILPEIGEEGQAKLKDSSVLVLGVGGLGSVVSELLVRAGIGKIILVDHDKVSLSNLQRQSLFREKDIGHSKAEVAKKQLNKINKEVEVISLNTFVNYENISMFEKEELGFDIVVDCTDNFFTRFLLNDYCMKYKLPFVFGSAVGVTGMVMQMDNETACFNCIFENKISFDNCDEVGILNTNNHIIASMQATEVIQRMTSEVETSVLFKYDAWNNTIDHIKVKKRKDCPTCNKKYEYLDGKKKYVIAHCKTRDVYAADLGKHIDSKKLIDKNTIKNEDSIILTKDGIKIEVYDHGRIEFYTKNVDKIKAFMDEILENN